MKRKFSHVTIFEIIAIIYGAMALGGLITVISSMITNGAPSLDGFTLD